MTQGPPQHPHLQEYLARVNYGPMLEIDRPRTAWPTVVGIFSIGLASLAILGAPLSLLMQEVNSEQRRIMESMPDWYHTYHLPIMFVGLVINALLLVAGINLVKRKPLALTLHLVYVAMIVAWGFVTVPVTLAIMDCTTNAMKTPQQVKEITKAIAYVAIPFGFIYPGFLLIWFLREKIRKEVAGWRAGIPLP
jgi:hypothetical protein